MQPEILGAGDWPVAVAERLLGRLAAQPDIRLCLPTGATPRPVYAELVRRVAGGAATLRAAEVFLLDEFGLPPGHPARCDRMLHDDLLAHVDLPADRFHRLDPCAKDLDAECDRFRALVDAGGLDLVLLGLGRNGHVGLNEPGSSADAPTRHVALDEVTVRAAASYGAADEALSWGLTLGLAEILAAREVWLLVTGGAKAAILDRVLHGPVGADVPATYLQRHPNARAIVDDGALPPA